MSGPDLKIAMLTTFYPPYNFGGDGIGISRLSSALAKRGCDVTVIFYPDLASLTYRALNVEVAGRGNDGPSEETCLRDLASARRTKA